MIPVFATKLKPGDEVRVIAILGGFEHKFKMDREKFEAILRTKQELNSILIIVDADFGHTTPIFNLTIGGKCHLQRDVNFAWPSAETAVMGPKGTVEIMFGNNIQDKRKLKKYAEEYREKSANPFIAVSHGYMDDIIVPYETRMRLCRSLWMLTNKSLEKIWKKHDNIPL